MREGSWLRKGAIVASWLAPATLKGEPSVDIGKIISIFNKNYVPFIKRFKNYQSQVWFDNIRKLDHTKKGNIANILFSK